MEKEKKQLGVAFIVVLVAIVMVSAIGIIAMSNKPVVLQGQIEATEIRISGKLPGRIDTFLVREGQYVKMGDTLVVINSPEAWAKFQQVNALEDIAKFQNKKIDDGTRRRFTKIAWSPASGKMKWKPCIKLLLPPNGRRINNSC